MTHGYLVLVRHGESTWNSRGLWTGWKDVPLSEKGRDEAKKAAKTLNHIKFDMAFTSDLKRAHESLEIIKKELNSSHLPTVRHKAYKERHYGIYTGKNKWEVEKKVGADKFRKIRRSWDEPIPEGESLKDVYKRVMKHFSRYVWPKLIEGHNILIVAHGNVHRALIKFLEKLSHEEIQEVEIATGEAVLYRINQKGEVVYPPNSGLQLNKGKKAHVLNQVIL